MQVSTSCKRPAVGMMVEHVVDGDQRHMRLARQRSGLRQACLVASAIKHGGGQPHAARGGGTELGQERRVAVHRDQFEPEAMRDEIVECEDAFAFFALRLPTVSSRVSRPQPARSRG